MNRKTTAILLTTHFLLVMVGGFIAWRTADRDGGRYFQQAPTASMPGKSLTEREPGHHTKDFYPTAEWRGSEYARAWNAVKNGKYTTRERIRMQRDLLRKWAEVDLVAAIEAALGEAWDRDGVSDDPSGPLLDVLSDALAKNPQEGWDLIRGRQFGVGTGMLRRVWMEAAGRRDPIFLAILLDKLSWRDRESAVEICHAAVQDGSTGVTEADLFKVFAGFPPEMVNAEQLLKFVTLDHEPINPAALKSEIIELGNDDNRMAKVMAMLLGKELAPKSPAEIATEIDDLPEIVREEVVWSAFKAGRADGGLLELVDLLIELEAWEKVEQRETVERVRALAWDSGAREVAEWALTLPLRLETTELFHRSVEPFLWENLEVSQAWLAALPPGGWHDRALAEYSQVALNSHNNTRASRWALDRIADADFKQEAEGWRAQWEKRTGWASN